MVGVNDDEFGQRIAAAVVLHNVSIYSYIADFQSIWLATILGITPLADYSHDMSQPSDTLDLAELREWLRSRLSNYKLPTILRVVPNLPKTPTFKVPKALIKTELFGSRHPDVQMWSGSRNNAKL